MAVRALAVAFPRLRPLGVLLGLDLRFPRSAPDRLALAWRASSPKRQRQRVQEVRRNGLPAEEHTHAEWVLELVIALGVHDRVTRGHCERVRRYAHQIAVEMGLTDAALDRLQWAALLHDIGKLFVPPEILSKPGPLTPMEWDIVRSHAAEGHDLVDPLVAWLGPWALAVGSHHERWDGAGYPLGLTGEEISMGARIVAVADAYDVMTSRRSYQSPRPVDEARAEIERCAGTQFDPRVIEAFLRIEFAEPTVGLRSLLG